MTCASAHRQRPPPALAVVVRRFPAHRHGVVDRLAVRAHRRPARLSATPVAVIPLLIIRQRGEIAQFLQLPGSSAPAFIEQHARQLPVKLAGLDAVGIDLRRRHRLRQQLQRADAVAFFRPHLLAPAAMPPAGKFPGDEKTVMLILLQRHRRRQQYAPLVGMLRDHRLAEIIHFIGTAKVIQTGNGVGQRGAHHVRIGLRIARQRGKEVVRLFPMPLMHQLIRLLEGVVHTIDRQHRADQHGQRNK